MRKYLSLITGYTNKTMYTAVEHLRDKNNVILKPQKAADVYSFGIILYEIVTKNRQYRQLGLREVQTKFADENFRPKLPEQIRVEVKNLIRRCWHESPERRPEMEEVIDMLRRYV
jgi:serine/threonine protein kinase